MIILNERNSCQKENRANSVEQWKLSLMSNGRGLAEVDVK